MKPIVPSQSLISTQKLGWITLIYLLGVILWGGFVRVSGSGAGCGSHWPLCNGQVIPLSFGSKTLIEFTHRLTSGLSLVLCALLLRSAYRHYPTKSWTRRGALVTFGFIILEALLGAGLVLFELVAENKSVLRTFSLGIHLINTFFLLASLVLTLRWSRQEPHFRIRWKLKGVFGRTQIGTLLGSISLVLGTLLLGASGAMTALGDTLFPVTQLEQGLRQDFSRTSHFLLQLRILHPVFAVLITTFALFFLFRIRKQPRLQSFEVTFFSTITAGLFTAQLLLGILNVLLLAPTSIQLGHLLLADLTWIFLILTLTSVWMQTEPTS